MQCVISYAKILQIPDLQFRFSSLTLSVTTNIRGEGHSFGCILLFLKNWIYAGSDVKLNIQKGFKARLPLCIIPGPWLLASWERLEQEEPVGTLALWPMNQEIWPNENKVSDMLQWDVTWITTYDFRFQNFIMKMSLQKKN